jgi:hypothetical protein
MCAVASLISALDHSGINAMAGPTFPAARCAPRCHRGGHRVGPDRLDGPASFPGTPAMTIWDPPIAGNITVSLPANTSGCLQVCRCASSQVPSSERSKTRSELFGFFVRIESRVLATFDPRSNVPQPGHLIRGHGAKWVSELGTRWNITFECRRPRSRRTASPPPASDQPLH